VTRRTTPAFCLDPPRWTRQIRGEASTAATSGHDPRHAAIGRAPISFSVDLLRALSPAGPPFGDARAALKIEIVRVHGDNVGVYGACRA
jgi:hypothetical protein